MQSLRNTSNRSAQQQNSPPNSRADFHFLYIAPAASVDYFFTAALRYWQTYRPIVLHDIEVVQHVPRQYSIVITSLSRSDSAEFVRDQIETTYGQRVYHDALVYDFIEDMQLTLDMRAERNEPYGVPLVE